MRNKKYGWLLAGMLAGMIIGRLTIPDEVWGAEPALKIPKGQTVIEDMTHPNNAEIEEALAYLSENKVTVPEEIERLCIQYGKENGIAPELLEAICWKESRFQADVVNASGTCHGIAQIHRGSHRARMERLGVTDLYDPKENLQVCADYLAELFEKYEDPETVLEFYNGDGAAAADPNRTSSYAQKVLNVSNALERVHYK